MTDQPTITLDDVDYPILLLDVGKDRLKLQITMAIDETGNLLADASEADFLVCDAGDGDFVWVDKQNLTAFGFTYQ